tara:strand:- start:185 stop:379 length:195 start_codon:yes stop_codon:yes gene_type:complete
MEVGDLVLYGACYFGDEDCQATWGLGIILSRTWNKDCMLWESIVWFEEINEHVLCDDSDLKKVA